MSLTERVRRMPAAGWAALFAVMLIVPGLGSFGFWDPWELGIADRARDVAQSGNLFDATAAGRYGAEPPLDVFLSAFGMKLFGARELGARLFNGVFGMIALLAVYWGGAGLFRKRAALLATLALGTMPLFVLQARQLTSDMPLVAGMALSLAGFGRYLWPANGRRSLRALAVAAVGLGIGLLSGGALLGVALPCLASFGAVLAAWGLRPHAGPADSLSRVLAPDQPGRDLPEGKSFGAGLLSSGVRGRSALIVISLVGLATLIVTLTTANIAGQYSLLLGGTPKGGTPQQTFEHLVRQLGFGLFPWSALAIFALGRGLVRLGSAEESDGGRLAFGQLYLLVFAAFGFALSTIFVLMTGDMRFPVLAPLALAIGVFLDEALEGERSEPVLGLIVGCGTMVVARDIYLGAEELVSVHLLNKVKWPPTLSIGYPVLAAGLVVGLGIYTGLATRGRALGRVALRDLGQVRPWRRRLESAVVEVGRWGIQGAVAVALIFAALLSHGLMPYLSRHYSFKPVLESYTRFAKQGEPIAKYRVEGHGAGFYGSREFVDVPSPERLVEFLRQPTRAFGLVPVEELAPLDAAFKLAKLDYFVLDASSSRFLLMSNRLGTGEQDDNPLRKNVWMAPRPPERIAAAPSAVVAAIGQKTAEAGQQYRWPDERPPWKISIPAQAVFADSIELLGADYPSFVRRPGKIPLTLYFRVTNRPPSGFKIFAHFDAPGEPRLIGDHFPLGGTFGTGHWLAGEYIRDYYEVDVPLMTTPAGTYTLLIGFWPGGEGKRLKITAGTNDGVDRARIGTIEVR